jgi:CCR4-NOT transcriptional regulation complex NOT5 subunit
MPISYTGLSIVLSKFPGRQETIERLFKKNESFQILCEDYRQCSEALKYWNESTSEDAAARRKEYEALLRDLGEEISQSVSESK